MRDLAGFVTRQREISVRLHGAQRHPAAPVSDVLAALRVAEQNPSDLLVWASVIMAALEGGLRSGSTPFALTQALVNAQSAMDDRRAPPPLAQMSRAPSGPSVLDEYGPVHV